MSSSVSVVNFLYEAERRFSTDLPISQLNLFARIPRTGSISVSELRNKTTLTSAGVSRSLAVLSGFKVSNRTVMDKFIEVFNDEKDRRFKQVKLTEKGRMLSDQLFSVLNTSA